MTALPPPWQARQIIKSVRWQIGGSASVFASAGNDRCVNVCDARTGGKGTVHEIKEAAETAINFVEWNSAHENVLLSAR